MKYIISDFGKKTAFEAMQDDFDLLKNIHDPILRFYSFSSLAATYGHFMNPEPFLNKNGIKKHKLQMAKRPTGGGFLLHGFDLTFSLIIPIGHSDYRENVKESYRHINEKVIQAIREGFGVHPKLAVDADSSPQGGFCMAKPTIYDVMLEGKKIGGSAQRRTKEGLLHQASINLKPVESSLLQEIFLEDSLIQAMISNATSLEGDAKILQNSLIQSFS